MRKLLLLIGLLLPSLAFAQGSRLDGVVQGLNGPIPNQFIAVCDQPANITTTPCSTLSTLYTDTTLLTPAPNPIQADFFGNFHFYAPVGKYTLQTYGPQIQTPYVQRDIILPCDPTNCVLGTLTVNIINFGTLIHNSNFVAATGTIRLQHDDSICWRNFAHSGDLCLTVDNSDAIQFPGGFGGGGGGGTTVTVNGAGVTPTLNLNDTLPVATANHLNLGWQYSAGNASVQVPITGNGTKVCSVTGALTTGHSIVVDASGNCVDSGSAPSSAIQAVTVTGCTVGAGTYNECTVTSGAVWSPAFASNAYKLVCTANGTTNSGGSKQSYIIYETSKSTTGFTLTMQNNRGSTPISAVPIDCIAVP